MKIHILVLGKVVAFLFFEKLAFLESEKNIYYS